MTLAQFKMEMSRLINCYPKASFPTDRQKLIYQECRELDQITFAKMVDYFIGDFKFAPLLKDFREVRSKLRSFGIKRDKAAFRVAAEDVMKVTNNKDDVAFKMDNIKRRLSGQIDNAEWKEFVSLLRHESNAEAAAERKN